jgi:oxygen-independent coproporphyrinogen-3 oxidase
MTSEGKLIRRNIHTYPFKYTYTDAQSFFAPERAAIYIHIPFCTKKCHFCDYVVYTNTATDVRQRYVDAVCKEIAAFPENPVFPAYSIEAVYFGGGTPGLLGAGQLVQLLDACRRAFHFLDDCEVCVEFDPDCVEEEKVSALHEAGFNRLSVGVQSFDDGILRNNNRPHDSAAVYAAMEIVRRAGFTHTNLDLIYPLFGLTMDLWQDSLTRAINLNPGCITAYPLEVWPKTAYYKWLVSNRKKLPDAAIEVQMARMAFDALEAAGFRRLSTSGYYHPERVKTYCRFLDYYWRTWPMIGFGVSSKSVIGDRLYTNIRSLRDYVARVDQGLPVLDFSTRMGKRQEMHRVMIRGFKMCEVSKRGFFERFGVDMSCVFGREIEHLVSKGYVVDDHKRVYLTREGQVFSSNVYEVFYTEDDLRKPGDGEVQFGISELIESIPVATA